MVLPILIAGALGAAATVSSSKNAARAQTKASSDQMRLQREFFNKGQKNLSPYMSAGTEALGAYLYENGLGPKPTGYSGLDLSPSAMFALEQGVDAIEGSAVARGGLFSGETMKGIEDYRFGLAQRDREAQLSHLAQLLGIGQASAAGQAASGQNFAAMGSQALANRGDALAAGHIAQGNALNNLLGNGMQAWGYMNNG